MGTEYIRIADYAQVLEGKNLDKKHLNDKGRGSAYRGAQARRRKGMNRAGREQEELSQEARRQHMRKECKWTSTSPCERWCGGPIGRCHILQRCRGCIYSGRVASRKAGEAYITCEYILRTGNKRGCPPGNCQRYTERRGTHGAV